MLDAVPPPPLWSSWEQWGSLTDRGWGSAFACDAQLPPYPPWQCLVSMHCVPVLFSKKINAHWPLSIQPLVGMALSSFELSKKNQVNFSSANLSFLICVHFCNLRAQVHKYKHNLYCYWVRPVLSLDPTTLNSLCIVWRGAGTNPQKTQGCRRLGLLFPPTCQLQQQEQSTTVVGPGRAGADVFVRARRTHQPQGVSSHPPSHFRRAFLGPLDESNPCFSTKVVWPTSLGSPRRDEGGGQNVAEASTEVVCATV